MKKLILLLLILSSFYSFSQKKNGPFEDYYKNGQVKVSGQYRDGKKNGKWQEYYETGELSRVYTHDNIGRKTGIQESYFKDGGIKYKTSKLNENEFVTRGFYEENGNIFYEFVLRKYPKSGFLMKNGFYKEYYKNGTLKIESNYLDSYLNGLLIQYYDSGEKEWEIEYFSDYKQGFYKQFYKNGTIKLEGVNSVGVKNGEEKRFSENGNLNWKGDYAENNFNRKWIQFDDSGNEVNIFKFKNGILKGSNEVALKPTKVPDWVFEKVPVYPGCEKEIGNKAQKRCMNKKMSQFIKKQFNTDLAANLGLSGKQKIYVIFKIDKTGKPVRIRSRAPRPQLEKEAIRVISKLPQMKPGYQRGKAVIAPYSLPIVFEVEKKVKKKELFDDPFFKKQ